MSYLPDVGYINHTIAAISTPRGEAAICVVRISGDLSLNIAREIFKRKDSKKTEDIVPRMVYLGTVFDPHSGQDIDETQTVFFRKPKTYTGEDMLEIYGHGGIYVSERILDAALKAGARHAERGEFTLRAFLNGKINLTQAESVLDIIKAKNDEFLKISLKNLNSELYHKIILIKNKLIGILAEIEVEIEYPDENILTLSEGNVKKTAQEIHQELNSILSTYTAGKFIREGIKVALLGPPNVGKSSIMNKLLDKERVIVTPIPGTTRDLVGDWITVGGMNVLLMDTAGLADDSKDIIEIEGIKRTKEFAEQADLIFFVLDGTLPFTNKIKTTIEIIGNKENMKFIINKNDLPCKINRSEIEKTYGFTSIYTSAITGEGIDNLKKIINNEVKRRFDFVNDTVITNYRHKECIEKALGELSEVLNSEKIPIDIISISLHQAAQYLSNILGENISDSILQEIFTNFCVGK